MCGEGIHSRHVRSKFSPEAAGETSSFWSLTEKLDKFLQNSLGGREVLGLGRRAGLAGAGAEAEATVGLSRLACKEQVFSEWR